MEPFKIITGIAEFDEFSDYAVDAGLGKTDLIITNKYIYDSAAKGLNLECHLLFQEQYGVGEPTDQMIDAILKDLKGLHYNRIIAMGGGTVIDIAKVLAVAQKEDTVEDLYDRMDKLTAIYTLVIIPTTCGTGSEVTNIAIINRLKKGVKQGLVSKAMYPQEAVLIPGMLKSLPYKIFASSCADAMIHAVESFLSPDACALSEIFSEKALDIILRAWKQVIDTKDKDRWVMYAPEFLRASNYAGIAFGYAGCAAVHALSYPLGSVHHIPHGESNSIMFAAVLKMYIAKKPVGKLTRLQEIIANAVNCSKEEALTVLLMMMNKIVDIKKMHCYGVEKEELADFTDTVTATQQRLLKHNYVELSRDEILSIYQDAF